MNKIKLHDTQSFTERHMPSEELKSMMRGDFSKFLIVRVEEMYRLVTKAVPASRSTVHTCIYLTYGSAVMKIGSDRYEIQKGEMLFVPAGQVFSFETGDVNRGYLCCFHNDMLIGKFGKSDLMKEFDFLRVWGNPVIRPDKQTGQFVLHILKRMLVEYLAHGLKRLNIIQPYLITLLCEVKGTYAPPSSDQQAASVKLTNTFRELLFSCIKTKHLVSDYAAVMHITPNHLNKIVKAVTGKSPTKWIDEAVVLEAKVLLYQSPLTISEIAAEVGIEDQSYFARLFKKHEGVTPTAFRRMIEKS